MNDVGWNRSLHGGDLDDARRRAEGDPVRLAALAAAARLYGARSEAWPEGGDDPQAAVLRAHAHLASLGAVPPPQASPGEGWAACARAITAFARGDDPGPEPPLDAHDPALRVEQMIVRGLRALSDGALDVATQHARRASRAAYAESLRGLEYLAYWLLGRTRRETRNLHAATRIFGALARAAPRPWWPLVDWELVLAGGDAQAAQRPLTAPASTWLDAVAHAQAERWDEAHAALDALRRHPLPARFAAERDLLSDGLTGVSALDARARVSGARVAGALFESAERVGLTPAVWSVAPDAQPTLRWCVGISGDAPRLLFGEGERIQGLAACLAEAGRAGLGHDEVFRAVYGFDYDAALHEGLFRVLLHRTRAALAGAGDVVREEATLVLRPERAMVLPEPRSAPPFGDRLLRAIAAKPGVSAKELAEQVGDRVRTVQRALRLLLDSGTCRSEKRGRQTVYTVEDTTFSEPTHFRERGGA
ncbi:MAG: hypothetical protein RLP09_06305 [Sandaracinaceae bacterium]